MPSRPKPLWVLTVLLLIGAPAANIIYWDRVLASGVLPMDADSVGIPMGLGIIFTILVTPFVLGVTWLCLRRYNPQARFFAWRKDRPFRSLMASLIFGGAAALLVLNIIASPWFGYPWYEFIFDALSIPAIVWSLAMRAAVIEQFGFAPMEQSDGTLAQ